MRRKSYASKCIAHFYLSNVFNSFLAVTTAVVVVSYYGYYYCCCYCYLLPLLLLCYVIAMVVHDRSTSPRKLHATGIMSALHLRFPYVLYALYVCSGMLSVPVRCLSPACLISPQRLYFDSASCWFWYRLNQS